MTTQKEKEINAAWCRYRGDYYRPVHRVTREKLQSFRFKMGERQNWKCCYCGCEMSEKRGFDNSCTLEHVVPRSLGGPDSEENIVAACYACNNARGDEFLDVHLKLFEMFENGELTG